MKEMKIAKKACGLFVGCLILITVVFFWLLIWQKNNKEKERLNNPISGYIVEINDIIKTENGIDEKTEQKFLALMETMRNDRAKIGDDYVYVIIIIYVCLVSVLALIFIAMYLIILRPFDELVDYAEDLAAGNFDRQLNIKRVNMFGRFTWAFDHMRQEISAARRCEKEAIENNKTVIATLSHDIKTPIASIRGYAEGLTMNMDSTPERRSRYANVIITKCDEVTKITEDMFIHSLQDLDKLSIKNEEIDLHDVISEVIEDFSVDVNIILENEVAHGKMMSGDRGRIAQVIENIIANSKKYAPGSPLHIYSRYYDECDIPEEFDFYHEESEGIYVLSIKDEGPGIPDKNLPFIFDKFYRGDNVGDAPGAGLGLYIVKYIMERMGGRVLLRNDNGLLVNLIFSANKIIS